MKKYSGLIKTNLVFSAIFIFLLLVDRVTKRFAVLHLMKGDIELIPDIFVLHYLENRGAAWGILQNEYVFFAIITAVVVAVMIFAYGKVPFTRKFWYLRFVLVLLSAGGVGNFIDRLTQHYVIDFIYVKCINFPVFNMADCFVCIASVLLMHCILFYYKDENLV